MAHQSSLPRSPLLRSAVRRATLQRSSPAFRCALALLFITTLSATLIAQDRRTVTEPRIPPACTRLEASLSAPHGLLSDADERRLDTERIQQAIDHCASGRAVELHGSGDRNVFLAAPFHLQPGVTLLIDADTVLYASRNPRDFDVSPGSCGVIDQNGHGCKPFIVADHAPHSAIMGDGAIDGRGGATLLGQTTSWWDLAHIAKINDTKQNCTRMLIVRESDDFTLYRITLRNSPNFHVAVEKTNGFTAWGVKIDTPATARNTDGIDPSASSDVSILHSYIRTGDDSVAIKAGRLGAASHITVAHNHFYSGHGMSIGSETSGGVDAVRVSDLTIDGADNGIRIKSDPSRGGLVEDVVYDDVCIRNVRNPIILTPKYTLAHGDLLPVYRDITLKDVHVVTPGQVTLEGFDATHQLGVALDNVFADGLPASAIHASNTTITLSPRLGNLIPAGGLTGENVSIVQQPGSAAGTPVACEARFEEYPANPTAPRSATPAPPVDNTLYVAADGSGDFYSIQRALDAAPADGAMLLIAPGTYRETISVTKPNIELRGSNPDASKTVIVFNKSAGSSGGTLHSATAEIHGDNFRAENLTFANDWNATHVQVFAGSQALAVLINADKAVFNNVRFLGNQDTLYAGSRNCTPDGEACIPTRQYFTHCYIEGNVDFIFGDSKAVFDHCEIHSTPHSEGFVTAQSKHYPTEDSGFVFNHCTLTAAPGAANIWLGRPWRPYAKVIFLNTEMGAHIVPAGWREWHPGETHSIETVYYAEYNSTGPGAHPGERDLHTKLLTAAEAAKFETKTFFDGWDPAAQ
ncbi:MAG: pectinesterase family protein [Terriglobales bacterium]